MRQDREFVEVIELNIMQIVSFLNTFDQSARYKLGTWRHQNDPRISFPDLPYLCPTRPDVSAGAYMCVCVRFAARINEKLSRLEHTLEYAEAAIKNTSPVADDETES
jgi:hypothetical protein